MIEKWNEWSEGMVIQNPATFFVLRDENWAKLGDAPIDLIWHRFLVAGTGKKSGPPLVFKPPKQFTVYLELTNRREVEVDDWVENRLLNQSKDLEGGSAVHSRNNTPGHLSTPSKVREHIHYDLKQRQTNFLQRTRSVKAPQSPAKRAKVGTPKRGRKVVEVWSL